MTITRQDMQFRSVMRTSYKQRDNDKKKKGGKTWRNLGVKRRCIYLTAKERDLLDLHVDMLSSLLKNKMKCHMSVRCRDGIGNKCM
jgi:hypothetical protein